MGYTHYWRIDTSLDKESFFEFSADARKIIHTAIEAGIAIAGGTGEGTSRTEDAYIEFNGAKDEAHETFGIHQNDMGFDFCKTARKPYDVVVTATLIRFVELFGESVEISSDGGTEDWVAGRNLYAEVFGKPAPKGGTP